MKGITTYRKFRLSVIASVLTIIIVAYWDRIWSEYWLLALPFGLFVIVLFIVALTQSLIFANSHKHITRFATLPLTINLLAMLLMIVLPLNWMRQYIEFQFRQSAMEEVVRMAHQNELEKVRLNSDLMQLPDNYSQLSVGGGEVIVEEVNDQKAVFFYTFRGTPDGQEGFVFIPNGAKPEDLEGRLYNKILNQRNVESNWYFILAD